jgi:hypothetical protein
MNGQQSEDMMIHIEQLEYHEDKVINGILHYLDGAEWREYSKEELTRMFLEEEEAFEEHIYQSAQIDPYEQGSILD